jgi:SAM-dependent methyltransferase
VPGDDDWEWDATLFAGAAAHYERGRLPYAPGLADAFEATLGLDGGGRLLDIGCGPGTVALRLSHLFAEVIGIDADVDMLGEAARLAARRSITNARWIAMRAEDLPAALGTFRTVTFAASLHWMDRVRVVATVRDMLEPHGVVVHVDNRHHDSLNADHADHQPPREQIDALRRAYLGDDRRAGQSIRNSSPDDEDGVFRAAGFVGPQVVTVADGRSVKRSVDDMVAETFSMSSTAPHQFGDRVQEFETDLRRVLAAASPDGTFVDRLPDNELKVWRPLRG